MQRLLGWLLVILVLLAVVVVVGPLVCGRDGENGLHGGSDGRLTGESFQKIQKGMNRQEVVTLLGLPSEDHTGSLAGSSVLEDGSRFLVWSNGSWEVTVHFNAEGLVTSKTSKGE